VLLMEEMSEATGRAQRIVGDARELTGVEFWVEDSRMVNDHRCEATVIVHDQSGVTERDLHRLDGVANMLSHRHAGSNTVTQAGDRLLLAVDTQE
jgi:hypothetical protein